MDGKIIIATFTAVFVAELADKTQLVGIGLAAKSGRPLSVWLGSVAAYAVVTVLSVFIGATLGKFIKPEFVRLVGASLFILIGVLIFLGKV